MTVKVTIETSRQRSSLGDVAHGVPLDGGAGHVVEGEGGVDVVDAGEHLVEAEVVRQADSYKLEGRKEILIM